MSTPSHAAMRASKVPPLVPWLPVAVGAGIVSAGALYMGYEPSISYMGFMLVWPLCTAGIAYAVLRAEIWLASTPMGQRWRRPSTGGVLLLCGLAPLMLVAGMAARIRSDAQADREAVTFLDSLRGGLDSYRAANGCYPEAIDALVGGEVPARLREQDQPWYSAGDDSYLFEFEVPSFAMKNAHFFDSRRGTWLDAISNPAEYSVAKGSSANSDR